MGVGGWAVREQSTVSQRELPCALCSLVLVCACVTQEASAGKGYPVLNQPLSANEVCCCRCSAPGACPSRPAPSLLGLGGGVTG